MELSRSNRTREAAADIRYKDDDTDKTRGALELLEAAGKRALDRELDWYDWAKLAAIDAGKQSKLCLERVREVAAQHESHPRLHAELPR